MRRTAIALVVGAASVLEGCTALLGDFTAGVPVDAGSDGIEGSSSDAASSDATLSQDAATDAGRTKPDGATVPDAVATTTDAADTGPLACYPGETLCTSGCVGPYCPCVYEKSDPDNCGACGHVCAAPTTSCQDGGCACPDAGTLCGTRCTNLQTDPNNCGACEHQCGINGDPNKNCVAGGCTCSPYC